MLGRIIVSSIFITCVVCVILGIVSVFEAEDRAKHSEEVAKAESKIAKSYCSSASEKDYCYEILNKTTSDDPREYFKTILTAAKEAVDSSLSLPHDFFDRLSESNNTDVRLTLSLNDCEFLLVYAKTYLEEAISLVTFDEPQSIIEGNSGLQQRLSAVLVSQESCLDEIETPEIKDELRKGLQNVTKISSIAMAMSTKFADVFKMITKYAKDKGHGGDHQDAGHGEDHKSEGHGDQKSEEGGHDDKSHGESDKDHGNNSEGAKGLDEEEQEHSKNEESHEGKSEGAGNTEEGHEKLRRLLGLQGEDNDFPEWVSAADRRLLEWHEEGEVKPNSVVAKDGSGNFNTISEALASYSENVKGKYIIYVKAGTYRENVALTRKHRHVFMYGDGPSKTIIQDDRSYHKNFTTFMSATMSVFGENFLCKSIGILNVAGPKEKQAVALRTDADFGMFYNCRIEGYQDTLLIQNFRQFFRNCLISGSVDIIFGQGTAVIQNSDIVVRKHDGPFATVAAHSRIDPNQPTGIVIHNCRIVPEKELYPGRFNTKTYLGRAWKRYSRIVIMQSLLADFIQPEGWHKKEQNKDDKTDDVFLAEYMNRGQGAKLDKRVQWNKFMSITKEDAMNFTVANFLNGDSWISGNGVPHVDGLLD